MLLLFLCALAALLVFATPRMTSTAIPQMSLQPRAFQRPDGVIVEPIRHPLFSTVGLNNAALPQEAVFFQYGRGDLVPGAGNFSGVLAQRWHTNLEKGGNLGRPKTFKVDGIRLYLPALASSAGADAPELSDPSFAAAAVDSELIEDWVKIISSGYLEFRVGEKLYAQAPLHCFPSNVGFGGHAALSGSNTNATVVSQDVCLPEFSGKEWATPMYPVTIDEQQNFNVRIRFQWATNPTLNDDRALVVVLDGILSRGIQ